MDERIAELESKRERLRAEDKLKAAIKHVKAGDWNAVRELCLDVAETASM